MPIQKEPTDAHTKGTDRCPYKRNQQMPIQKEPTDAHTKGTRSDRSHQTVKYGRQRHNILQDLTRLEI